MRTALFDKHRALGAKIVDFAGFEMPLQYQGIIEEHNTVRERAGLFDVSHMGRVDVFGADAEKFLDFLSTNKIAGKNDFTATYTVWCLESGGAVDDLIVYKKGPESFFVIVNASNREKDLNHMRMIGADYDVTIRERFSDGILALQGPLAVRVASKIFGDAASLSPMHFAALDYQGEEIILSGTGYTGAGGVEIYGKEAAITDLWDRLLDAGKDDGIQPIGLGARDTLRLEMGYALYGHELSEWIAPTESVSSWTVKWEKGDFLGKKALERLEAGKKKRSQYGFVLDDKGIAREGFEVFCQGEEIGKVTSGTFSPSLRRPIAIIMVERNLKENENVEILIRNRKCGGKVAKLPFYQRSKVKS
jgi:aminomethyltransferase